MEFQPFVLDMAVRDYELDTQGIVNNAVYQQYLEHARHEYLKSVGIDFKACADAGVNLVVIRAELEYRSSLTSGDRFSVEVRMTRETPVRFAFHQTICRAADGRPVMQAKIIGTALNQRGRPHIPELLAVLLAAPPA